jgi:hypothetical protein
VISSVSGQNLCLEIRASVAPGACAGSPMSGTVRVCWPTVNRLALESSFGGLAVATPSVTLPVYFSVCAGVQNRCCTRKRLRQASQAIRDVIAACGPLDRSCSPRIVRNARIPGRGGSLRKPRPSDRLRASPVLDGGRLARAGEERAGASQGHTPPSQRAPPRACGSRPSRACARRQQPARSSTQG